MSLKREQILFLGTLVIAGTALGIGATESYQSRPMGKPKTGTLVPAPPVPEIVFTRSEDARPDPSGRDVFQPPREWTELPPLVLDAPPLPEITALGPLPLPAAEPEKATIHRRGSLPLELAAALDAEATAGTESRFETAGDGAASAAPAAAQSGANGANGANGVELDKAYDWVKRGGQSRLWGFILNKDRVGLLDHTAEAIEFQGVDPKSGKRTVKTTLARADLENGGVYQQGFGFADTVAMRAKLLWRETKPAVSNVKTQLQAARTCLTWVEEDRSSALTAAEQFVRSALSFDPGLAEAYELLAMVREYGYDDEGELAILDEAKAKGIETSYLLMRRGVRLRQLGLKGAAHDILVAATEKNPNDHQAWAVLGRTMLDDGDAVGATDAFERALRSANIGAADKTAVLVDLARAHLVRDDKAEAGRALERAVGLDVETAELAIVQGAFALANGKPQDAIEPLRRALALDPGAAEAVYNLAVALSVTPTAEAITEARKRYAEAADLAPLTAADPTCGLGILDEALGRDDRAADAFARALEMDPNDAFVLYRAGRNARRRGDVDQATTWLQRSLKEHGRYTDVLNELGYAMLLTDRPETAEEYFVESLKREPGNGEVQTMLGMALLRQQRAQDARAAFESAGNDRVAALAGAAWCLYRLGDADVALQRFAEARAAAADEANPFSVYSDRYQKAITDHRAKEQWVDVFDRTQIKNGWDLREAFGPTLKPPAAGRVALEGIQRAGDSDRWTELRRIAEGKTLVQFDVEVTSGGKNEGVVGAALYLEKPSGASGQELEPGGLIAVARFPDGSVRLLAQDSSKQILRNWDTLPGVKIAAQTPARFTIEFANRDKGVFHVKLDEKTIAADVEVPSLKKPGTKPFQLSVFAMAKERQSVDVSTGYARVVRYRNN
ncbi:MAG: tetratricopeptide repeat protein [Planctomycetes bacterium]|nr:tetratricopeptide repeat protein [Planctomycetota bacterium]